MQLNELYAKAAGFGFLTVEEGVYLYHHAPLADLMLIADELRKKQVPHGKVTWQIDRNVNTTNVCIANCKFCNFYRIPGHEEAYITDIETYKQKIDETIYFDNEAEARQYATAYNMKYNTAPQVPDWYMRAEYCGKVG